MCTVIAAVVLALHHREQLALGTLVLAGRETVAAHTLHLGKQSLVALHQLAVGRLNITARHVQRGADAEAAERIERCRHERSIGLARNVAQTLIHHQRYVARDVGHEVCHHRTAVLLGHGLLLVDKLHIRSLHLGVGEDADDRLFIAGDTHNLLLRRIGRRCGDVGHHGLDLLLHGIDIDVTNDDHSLIVGTVPLVIEGLQIIVREALQTVQITYKVAMLVLRAAAYGLDHVDRRTPRGTVTRTQLLHDHAALRVDLLGLQRDEVRPVVQHQQRRVDHALALYGYIGHIILRQVPRSEGVEVGAELHADLLEILRQTLLREVLRTVEGHVLEEVGQTLLRVVLLYGSNIVYDIELGHALRFLVVADVVGQSVGQFARADLLVGLDLLHGVHLRNGLLRTPAHEYQGHQQQ